MQKFIGSGVICGLLYVLLVWAALGTSLFYFFNGGIMFPGAAVVPPYRAASAPPQAQGDDEIYTGSIIVVQPRGNQC